MNGRWLLALLACMVAVAFVAVHSQHHAAPANPAPNVTTFVSKSGQTCYTSRLDNGQYLTWC